METTKEKLTKKQKNKIKKDYWNKVWDKLEKELKCSKCGRSD